MPPEIWVVTGTLKDGTPFAWPEDWREPHKASKAEADDTVRRMTRRGHSVAAHREVWDGPAAAYRKPREP